MPAASSYPSLRIGGEVRVWIVNSDPNMPGKRANLKSSLIRLIFVLKLGSDPQTFSSGSYMFNSIFQLHINIQQSEKETFHFLKICCELVNLEGPDIKLRLK